MDEKMDELCKLEYFLENLSNKALIRIIIRLYFEEEGKESLKIQFEQFNKLRGDE